MKNVLLGSILLFFSQNIFAQRYECGLVNGVEEYAIYVGLDKKVACFFDNDTCINIKLSKVDFLETYPEQTVYTFEGETRASGKVKIRFNLERLSASVTEYIGTSSQQTLKSLDGCKKSSDIVFDN